MANILDRILATKREEVAAAKARTGFAEVLARARASAPVRDFAGALRDRVAAGKPAVIAEIKRGSPSAGTFRHADLPPFDPAAFAASYEAHGAACLSVLTDRDYFGGCDDDLVRARAACALPVLRKDFIVDEYQIAEARALGADAVLFILGTAPLERFREWEALACDLGLSVLAESHDGAQLAQALALQTPLIGINNRDLTRFTTDVATTLELKSRIPADRLLVTESGIDSQAVAADLRRHGVNAFLIGGAFMSQPDPGRALAAHFGDLQRA